MQSIIENNAASIDSIKATAAEALHYLEMMQSVHNTTVIGFGVKSNEAAQSAVKLAVATREAIKAEVRVVLCDYPDIPSVTIRYVDAAGVKSEFSVDRNI